MYFEHLISSLASVFRHGVKKNEMADIYKYSITLLKEQSDITQDFGWNHRAVTYASACVGVIFCDFGGPVNAVTSSSRRSLQPWRMCWYYRNVSFSFSFINLSKTESDLAHLCLSTTFSKTNTICLLDGFSRDYLFLLNSFCARDNTGSHKFFNYVAAVCHIFFYCA